MTDKAAPVDPRPIRTFGRVGGRSLSARQQALVEDLLPRLAVPEGLSDPRMLFPGAREVWLEIGFGGGEHLVEQARRHPEVGVIGCEPFIEGMAKALTGIEANGLTNVRLLMDDARPLVAALDEGCLDRVFILFPDPWRKKRQQKRRLIQPDFLASLYRACRKGARVRFATDVASYADEALGYFLGHGGFDWQAKSADDWRLAPADHVTTRYETKKLGDCAPVWFNFLAQ
ncbi:MAG: tRNA (guanosine(46)-N7)-methyltransferase TrmB [Hyphomonas sp.]|uniref:tRNA (guanosine(46)-N7)-methyltransferase TrmB n=1 Tax=Hyphomonas sp. TaxID=87 RepID=UPI003526FD59